MALALCKQGVVTPVTVEAFIFTSGSSILEWSVRCVQEQRYAIPHRVISGMPIDEAMNFCLTVAKADYFIKVDDDMLLHPYAAGFMQRVVSRCKVMPTMCSFMLWQPWNNRVVKSIKLYNTRVARKIGFRRDERGKIDRSYVEDIRAKYPHPKDGKGTYNIVAHKQDRKSVLAIHALRSIPDQIAYRDLWMRNSGAGSLEDFEARDHDQATIVEQDIPYENQYKRMKLLFHLNEKRASDYYRYLRSNP